MFAVTANQTGHESDSVLDDFVDIQLHLFEQLGLHLRFAAICTREYFKLNLLLSILPNVGEVAADSQSLSFQFIVVTHVDEVLCLSPVVWLSEMCRPWTRISLLDLWFIMVMLCVQWWSLSLYYGRDYWIAEIMQKNVKISMMQEIVSMLSWFFFFFYTKNIAAHALEVSRWYAI